MDKVTFNALPDDEKFQTLEGVAYYASVHRPNTAAHKKFGSAPIFVVHLGLEGEELEKALAQGLRVEEPTDNIPMKYVRIKRNVKEITDPEASRPTVVDSMQNDVPMEISIGNGSRVRCKYARYWYDNNGGGQGITLLKTQILDLVPYESQNDSDFVMEEKGFTVGGLSTTRDEKPFESDNDLPPLFDDE